MNQKKRARRFVLNHSATNESGESAWEKDIASVDQQGRNVAQGWRKQ
jgi:hypothetical protein